MTVISSEKLREKKTPSNIKKLQRGFCGTSPSLNLGGLEARNDVQSTGQHRKNTYFHVICV